MTARIVTFYGFRRGTGRTLAVANLSWILASAGKRVLVMDWDLKSPQLAQYFRPFLTDPDLKSTDGLIDYFRDLQLSVASSGTEQPPGWYDERADITPYTASVDMKFPDRGAIDLLSTGRQSSTYSTRLSSFSWSDFYGRFDGGLFLDATRRRLRDNSDYDYILIDSEPGMDAAAAVCTVQMPDDLVVCFTPADDPEAAADALRSIVAQRDHELRVFPVPMRVPAATTWRRQRAPWMKAFDGLPGHLGTKDRITYWREVSFQEFPEYVAQRTLATLNDEPGSTRSLLTASETLTRYLTDGSVTSIGSFVPGRPPAKGAPVGSANVFISYSHDDDRFKEELVSMLRPLVRNGPIVPWDDSMIQAGDLWKEEIRKALNSAHVAVLLVSRHFLESEFITTDELPPLLLAAKTRGLAILWVLVGACLYDEVPSLAQFQAAHDPAKPLERLGVSRRNESWVKICQQIKAAVLARQPASVEHT